MDVMSKWKWRLYRSVCLLVQSHKKLWLLLKYETSLWLVLWGGTEVSTSKSGGTAHRIHFDKVSTFEGNGCL